MPRPCLIMLFAVVSVLRLEPGTAAAAEALVGTTGDGRVVTVHSDSPSSVRASAPLTGLDKGDAVLAMARRPSSGAIYGIARSGSLLRANPVTGQVTRIGGQAIPQQPTMGQLGLAIDGSERGFVVTSAGSAYRLDLDTGSATPLSSPRYPDVSPQTRDTLARPVTLTAAGDGRSAFELDLGRNGQLSAIDTSPGGGARTVGPLGFGFVATPDAPPALTAGADGTLFAAFIAQSFSPHASEAAQSLLRVDPRTGTARPAAAVSVLGAPVTALTAVGRVADDRTAPTVSVSLSSTQLVSRLLSRGLQSSVSCQEACEVKVVARLAGTSPARSTSATLQPELGVGQKVITLKLRGSARDRLRRNPNSLFSLEFRTTDGAGNTTVQRRVTRAQTLRQRRSS